MATARELLIIIRLQDEATRGLRQLTNELSGIQGPLGMIAKGAVAAGAALAAVVTGVGAVGVNFLRMRESAEIGLGFVLRNGQLARDMIADLVQFSLRNPVPIEPLIQAARVMAGYGMEATKVLPTLKAIANANAAIGGTTDQFNRIAYAIAQVEAKGRVQAEEIRQLANAGIPALAILAEKTGMTQAQLLQAMKQGKLGIESVSQLIDGIQERFQGALEASGNTMNGLLTRIGNFAKAWAATAAEPAFEIIKGHLRDIVKLMESPVFLGSAQLVAGAIRTGAAAAGNVVQQVGAAVQGAGRAATGSPDVFGGGEGEAASGTTARLGEAAIAVENIRKQLAELWTYVRTYVLPVLGELWGNIVEGIQTKVIPWLQRMRDKFFEFFNDQIIPLVAAAVDGIGNELSRFGPWIQNTFIPAMINLYNIMAAQVEGIIALWKWLWPKVEPYVMLLVRQVGRLIANIRDVVAIVFALLAGDWESAWTLLKDIATRILEGLRDVVATIVAEIISSFTGIPVGVINAVRGKYTGVGARTGGTRVSPVFGGGEGEEVGGVTTNGAGGLTNFINGLLESGKKTLEDIEKAGLALTGGGDTGGGGGLLDDIDQFDTAINNAAKGASRVADEHDKYLKLVAESQELHLKATARVAEELMKAAEELQKAKERIQNYFLNELNQLTSRGTKFSDQAFKVWAGAAGLTIPEGPTTYWSSDNPGVASLTPWPGQQAVSVSLSSDLSLDGVQ